MSGRTMREDARGVAGRIDEQRLWRRDMELAKIGAIPGNGVDRATFSREDIATGKRLIA